METSKDFNLNDVDDLYMKIFEKSNYRDIEEDIKGSILDSDDSDTKIFVIKRSR